MDLFTAEQRTLNKKRLDLLESLRCVTTETRNAMEFLIYFSPLTRSPHIFVFCINIFFNKFKVRVGFLILCWSRVNPVFGYGIEITKRKFKTRHECTCTYSVV